jgi:glucosamine-6-phosphate deaminase
MRLEVVPTDRWAAHVADLWVERLGADPALRMCLATGSTPVPVYEEMGRRVAAGEVSFAAATVFVLDEWLGLPTGHEVRCDTMLRRDLLQRVDLAEHRVHLFGVDTGDPAVTCELFDAAIRAGGGLDLAVLGLGRNGHLGMNEPGTPFDAPTRIVELAEETRIGAGRYGELSEPPTHGVTVGLGPLIAAEEVWLLVAGPAKADILAHVLEGPIGPDVPATSLRTHPGAVVIADGPAASKLSSTF